MKFDIISIQYTVTANDRYFIHSVHLTLRETEKYFSAYLLDWKVNVGWIDSYWYLVSSSRIEPHAVGNLMDLEIVHTRLDGERAMRFRPPDDRKERKSSHGAKEIWNYSVMVLYRYAVL